MEIQAALDALGGWLVQTDIGLGLLLVVGLSHHEVGRSTLRLQHQVRMSHSHSYSITLFFR